MGSDEVKIEKKRFKAEVKAEKARSKDAPSSEPNNSSGHNQLTEKSPWYKDPNWVRAIIAIATFVVMVIALALTTI